MLRYAQQNILPPEKQLIVATLARTVSREPDVEVSFLISFLPKTKVPLLRAGPFRWGGNIHSTPNRHTMASYISTLAVLHCIDQNPTHNTSSWSGSSHTRWC